MDIDVLILSHSPFTSFFLLGSASPPFELFFDMFAQTQSKSKRHKFFRFLFLLIRLFGTHISPKQKVKQNIVRTCFNHIAHIEFD